MEDIKIDTKGCPLLIQTEEHKALMIGNGDYTVSYMLPCIKDKCMAYKDGYCKHFEKEV